MELNITALTVQQIKDHAPNLYKSIQENVDPSDTLKKVEKELAISVAAETEANTANTALDKENTELKTENETLKKENDQFKAEKADAEKHTLVASKLKEAKLPEHLVSDWFKSSLLKLSEEDMDKEIADRKQISEKSKGKIEGMGDEHKSEEEESKEATESKKKKVSEDLFGDDK